ncbi:MAG: superoxide dismutase [Betaproteobacteria bacterium]|nr:MAG: superoxide dismutase [Betaproteobacteria bacterium]
MKVVIVATRKEDAKPEEFAPHLEEEANTALRMYRDEFVREIYNRTDGKGAILVLEADDEDHAKRLVGELPLAKLGLLSFEIYGTKPYRGIVAHVK